MYDGGEACFELYRLKTLGGLPSQSIASAESLAANGLYFIGVAGQWLWPDVRLFYIHDAYYVKL